MEGEDYKNKIFLCLFFGGGGGMGRRAGEGSCISFVREIYKKKYKRRKLTSDNFTHQKWCNMLVVALGTDVLL